MELPGSSNGNGKGGGDPEERSDEDMDVDGNKDKDTNGDINPNEEDDNEDEQAKMQVDGQRKTRLRKKRVPFAGKQPSIHISARRTQSTMSSAEPKSRKPRRLPANKSE
jgi:hypothetical protein